MSKVKELLKEAEQLLKTDAFMECCAAERCEECITQALALLDVEPGEFRQTSQKQIDKANKTLQESKLESDLLSLLDVLLTIRGEACDIIDQLQAENKQLKKDAEQRMLNNGEENKKAPQSKERGLGYRKPLCALARCP